MSELERTLAAAVEGWEKRGWPKPAAVVVSGSGLAVDLGTPVAGPLPLQDLLPFPVHAVEGHPLLVEVIAPSAGHPVLYFRGRLHSYQGYEPWQVVFPIRLAARLGARTLLLTNAAGGLKPESQRVGQLNLLSDHLNLSGINPLRGEIPAHWGPRFPEMVNAYDADLRRLATATAAGLGVRLGEAVYAGLAGPSYETPAEFGMLRTLGADQVGMSTVVEVIAARHMGLRCLALSLITNVSAQSGGDHDEVLAAGRAAAEDVRRILGALLLEAELYGD
jgi:purine-nucleoside phosphorylase